MPKVTLEFQIPEEQEELELAQNGSKLAYLIHEFDQFLRSKIKYGNLPEAEHLIYLAIRDKFWEIKSSE